MERPWSVVIYKKLALVLKDLRDRLTRTTRPALSEETNQQRVNRNREKEIAVEGWDASLSSKVMENMQMKHWSFRVTGHTRVQQHV